MCDVLDQLRMEKGVVRGLHHEGKESPRPRSARRRPTGDAQTTFSIIKGIIAMHGRQQYYNISQGDNNLT